MKTTTIRVDVKTIEEAVEFFAEEHKKYMEHTLTNARGYTDKTESWHLDNGKGWAQVVIKTEF